PLRLRSGTAPPLQHDLRRTRNKLEPESTEQHRHGDEVGRCTILVHRNQIWHAQFTCSVLLSLFASSNSPLRRPRSAVTIRHDRNAFRHLSKEHAMSKELLLAALMLLAGSGFVRAQDKPADPRDLLRYDGKPFAYWESLGRNELKAERRVE